MEYEFILERMLKKVPQNIDKREGSMIYNALAPAAAEMAQMHVEIGFILNQVFADTASRKYLIKRAAERGIAPKLATKAILKGKFNIDIPIGSRFTVGNLIYTAIEKIDTGVYKMECEKTGTSGNGGIGQLIPVDYIKGLELAQNTEILVLGQDEEETEVLRKRYFNDLKTQAYGGNIADYKIRIKNKNGVGGVKVYPVWNGGGTVKLVIIDSAFSVPSQTLVNSIQEAVDPPPSGKGKGFAPIGHVVTVKGATYEDINIDTKITYQRDWTWKDIKKNAEGAVDNYFLELAKSWEESDGLIVRISQIETRLLDIPGVLDIEGTKLNGKLSNLALPVDSIPKRGVLNG